jgi:probable F420-dependent oxidoreductase
MPPAFVPARHGFGPPPVLLAGVGPRMTAMAGAVADGFIAHAACGPTYLREVTLPALRRGRGGALDGFELVVTQMLASGRDEAELATARERVRGEIAFYGSTPAYRDVFAASGHGEVADRLHRLSREGRWSELAALVDDELLREVAVVAPPEEVAAAVRDRHPDADRVSLYAPGGLGPELVAEIGAAAPVGS